MARLYHSQKTGKEYILLNPSEKAYKYGKELKQGYRITNAGQIKSDENGQYILLEPNQRAYRSGFIAHDKETKKVFKAKNPNYQRKTVNADPNVFTLSVKVDDGYMQTYVNGEPKGRKTKIK